MLPEGPVLHIGSKSEDLAADGQPWKEKLTFATIAYSMEGVEYKGEKIVIYQDRVFWPCEKKK
jgi:hypothetical protein